MESDELRPRLRRIEGQIQGIQRMLEEGRTCEDVLTQTLAIRSALEQVALLVTERHLRECVAQELARDDPLIPALMEVLRLCLRAGAPAGDR